MSVYIHPTALIEDGVRIGEGSSIWDNVHIRRNTVLGDNVIVGEKTHISYDVQIGSLVKINAFVYICTAVTIEDGVMISAGTIFTNDRFPRAATAEVDALRSSDPDESTRPTLVLTGATVGAGAIVGCDLTIGRFAMVGMGSVLTRSVGDYHLVVGNPARAIGYVCRCGEPFARFEPGKHPEDARHTCAKCHRRYRVSHGKVSESAGAFAA